MNNPLAVMMGFAQLLMLDEQCSSRMRYDLQKVYAEMNRIAHSIEKLHAFALSLQNGNATTAGRRPEDVVATFNGSATWGPGAAAN
jgi:hypothetical protein